MRNCPKREQKLHLVFSRPSFLLSSSVFVDLYEGSEDMSAWDSTDFIVD